MTLNWIVTLLVTYGVMAAAGSAALWLVLDNRRRMRRQQKCHLAESESLRSAMEALQATLAGLEDNWRQACVELKHHVPAVAAVGPARGLNASQRVEALRMYRHGSDPQTVAKALGLKTAEVVMLEKIHFLSCGAA